MKEFDKTIEILERLLGPNGCPWDQEQTLLSLRKSVLEEVYEVIDAINHEEDHKIAEELGDLFFNAVFLCKMGEKEKRFTLEESLRLLNEKLIRRHPHVFGSAKAETSEEVLVQWEKIKTAERGAPKSKMDGIPKALPALARVQEMCKKMKKVNYPMQGNIPFSFETENELGEKLFAVAQAAFTKGIDAEQALLKIAKQKDENFREWEFAGELKE